MPERKRILDMLLKGADSIRASGYTQGDIYKRLELLKMDIAEKRAELFNAKNAKEAEKCRKNLTLSMKEYRKALEKNRRSKIG